MTETDLDLAPRRPITEVLKSITDRVTREPQEQHPDRQPRETVAHPVTRIGASRRERIG